MTRESRAKIAGHDAQSILIVFPLGLLAKAAIFGIVYLLNDNSTSVVVSSWMIVSGLVGGLLAVRDTVDHSLGWSRVWPENQRRLLLFLARDQVDRYTQGCNK